MSFSDTRHKHRFSVEFPVNASPKILYPYLATASGLEQWFCQRVKMESGQHFNFEWDSQPHYAEMSSHRTNRSVRFCFLNDQRQPVADANYLDFLIEESQLTQEVYLRVIDYSEETDEEELEEMWTGLIRKLREQVGG